MSILNATNIRTTLNREFIDSVWRQFYSVRPTINMTLYLFTRYRLNLVKKHLALPTQLLLYDLALHFNAITIKNSQPHETQLTRNNE